MTRFSASVAALVLLFATNAVADEGKSKANAMTKEANKAFSGKHYNDALTKYQEAYKLHATHPLLLKISATLLHLGRCAEAIENATAFSEVSPGREAERAIADAQDTCPAVDVTSNPPGANLWVDGAMTKSVGVTPWSGRLAAGDHTLIAKLAGHEDVRADIVIEHGKAAHSELSFSGAAREEATPPDQGLSLTPGADASASDNHSVPPAPKVPAGPPANSGVVAGWTILAIGVAALVGGGVVGGIALSDKAALGKPSQTLTLAPNKASTAISGINSKATLSVGLLGGGGALAAGGLTLVLVF